LEFVTPVTGIANVTGAFVAPDLNFSAGCEAVQTGIVVHHQCAIVIVVAAAAPVYCYGSSNLCSRRRRWRLFARSTRIGGPRINSLVGVQMVMMMTMVVMIFGCCC
jgi:hypothetical protein